MTIYVSDNELENIVTTLKSDAEKLPKWLHDSNMNLHIEKYHLLIIREKKIIA